METGAGDAVDANPFRNLHPNRGDAKTRPTADVKPIQHESPSTYSDIYNMNHTNRGVAIIINNHTFHPKTKMPTRTGSFVDAASLKQKFFLLGFEALVYDNVNKKLFADILHKSSKMDHTNNDCFCLVILTHGEEGIVYMVDGTVQIDDVFEPFKGNNCHTLVGKPKLFFIQACRGTRLDDGVEYHDGPEDMPDAAAPRIPAEADFLMAYSVVPGYFSWRNSQNGSWFAQALARVLHQHGSTMDLLSMMTRVNKIVAYEFQSNATTQFMNKKKQIPCITSMLTKEVYFKPKPVT